MSKDVIEQKVKEYRELYKHTNREGVLHFFALSELQHKKSLQDTEVLQEQVSECAKELDCEAEIWGMTVMKGAAKLLAALMEEHKKIVKLTNDKQGKGQDKERGGVYA